MSKSTYGSTARLSLSIGPVGILATIATLMILIAPHAVAGGRQDELLQAHDWTAVSLDGDALVPDSLITLSFSDRAGGSAGCNQYSFDYRAAGGEIDITNLVSTTMACDNSALMNQEARFLRLLNDVEAYEVSEQLLTLTGPGSSRILFEVVPGVADASLVDTDWRVEGIVEGEIARSLYAGNEITLRFAEGTVAIESACEAISALFSLDGSRIVTQGVPDQPACANADYEQDLSAVLTTLRSQPSYTIEARSLRLYGPDGSAVDLRTQ